MYSIPWNVKLADYILGNFTPFWSLIGLSIFVSMLFLAYQRPILPPRPRTTFFSCLIVSGVLSAMVVYGIVIILHMYKIVIGIVGLIIILALVELYSVHEEQIKEYLKILWFRITP